MNPKTLLARLLRGMLHGELAQQWLSEAESLAGQGDFEGAKRSLRRVAEDSEYWRQARVLLADIDRELGQWASAATNYALGLQDSAVAKDNVATYYKAGICALEAGRTEAAADLLEVLQAFDPDYRDIDELMARLTWFGRRSPQRARLAAAVTSASRRFEIGALLGEGASGAVYRARDTLLDRDVAVKTLSAEAAEAGDGSDRFLDEARAAAALSHPNIVAVYDFGVAAGELFLAMELVAGPTLREVLRRDGPLSALALRSVAEQACDALGYAHERGVMHLDIKPANLLITTDGALKIADFGLARWLADTASGPTLTASGATLIAAPIQSPVGGTPLYLAPERILGQPVTPGVDIYALGVTLFELATGQVPFGRGDILQAQLDGAAPAPSTLRPDLPAWVDRVVAGCLRKSPKARFGSTEELRAELGADVGASAA